MNMPTLTANFYGGWSVLHPNGELMFRCEAKRANWYLKRELAKLVGEKTIQLLFEPAGQGHIGDVFYTSPRENKCVVCGTDEGLTKHHVIPYMYRRFLPVNVKSRASHDVLIICEGDHIAYEFQALKLKQLIQQEYEVELPKQEFTPRSPAAKAAYIIYVRPGPGSLPAERLAQLKNEIDAELGRPHTEDDVARLIQERPKTVPVEPGAEVMKKVIERGEVQAFIKRWRQHFIDTTQPSFMPPGWNVERE